MLRFLPTLSRILLPVLCLSIPLPLAAQSDILSGRVVDQEGKPIAGATVIATSLETGVSRSVLTGNNGRYMILFADGGGIYQLRVSFLGMADQVLLVRREADEEVLLTDVVLRPQAIELEGITVRGRPTPPTAANTGERTQELPTDLLARLPLPDFDPVTLALLASGTVQTLADSVEGRLGFSVAGMSDALNQITLDGMSVASLLAGGGGLDLPLEGLRRTRVVTSTFDASRGGFAGGLVAMTTARGNNFATGSFTYQLRDAALSGNPSRSPLGNAATQHRLSGGYGGPLVRNKLFYNVSFALNHRRTDLLAMAPGDELSSQRMGVASDSVGRFLGILAAQGFPLDGLTGPYANRNRSLAFQARGDWNVTPSHTLMFRTNVNLAGQDSTRISPFDLRHNGGEQESNRFDAALQLTSRLGGSWTNEFMMSGFRSSSDTRAFLPIPEGRIRVVSELDDGSVAVGNLVFGGDRSLPTETSEKRWALRNETGTLLGLSHRVRAGVEVSVNRFASINQNDVFGTFTFNSLEDFEANRPSAFSRALTPRKREGGGLTGAAWISDTWRPTEPLQLTLGLRLDSYRFSDTPEFNPAVEEVFGRRTDRFPSTLVVSPRLGFSYRLSPRGAATRVVRGGVGLFAGAVPANLFAAAMQQTGLPGSEVSLYCIGSAVPIPDWNAYRQDPSTIPTRCLDGGMGSSPLQSARQPSVTVFHPSFRSPGSWRVNLGFELPVSLAGRQLPLNLDYTYARGVNLYRVRDLNLDEGKTFLLPAEGRPFFGDPSAIVPSTARVSYLSSRVDRSFGNVYEYVSDLSSEAHQFTLRLNGMLPWQRIFLQGSYTLGFVRDQSGFSGSGLLGGAFGGFSGGGFASTPTAGNPNRPEWAPSNNDRRHSFSAIMAWPARPSLQLTLIGRLTSGAPFTPLVGSDINGDGARNDRAFIFDPLATADPELAAGMQRLLDRAPGRVRDCLESQMGTIAGRNSCRNPWTHSLDMRLSLTPELPRMGRRLTLSADLSNVPAALDQLFHGKQNLRGWGQPNRADPTLLYPRSFDPATLTFRYDVNEQFGRSRSQRFSQGAPFQLVLQAQLRVGRDPGGFLGGLGNLGALGALAGSGGRGGGLEDLLRGAGALLQGGGLEALLGGAAPRGGAQGLSGAAGVPRGGGGAGPQSLFERFLANPVLMVLERKDSLSLTEEQVGRLQPLADSLQVKLAARRNELAQRLQGAQLTDAAALTRLFQELQPQAEAYRREVTAALEEVRRILTEEQWERLPPQVRNPFAPLGPWRGGGGGDDLPWTLEGDNALVSPGG